MAITLLGIDLLGFYQSQNLHHLALAGCVSVVAKEAATYKDQNQNINLNSLDQFYQEIIKRTLL